ncbi:Major facilitator superfamily (MFS) profile domain-containing protein OS=Streptomyces microflavus OX=1919 GN=Smic_20790 PE=4 SV=1 [Streptomyces microflavus]
MARTGAKTLAVAGVLITAAGFGWQSTMGVDGSYLTAICLPGVLMMAGAGLTLLATLATSGAAAGDAGRLRPGQHLPHHGRALGLAVLSTVAAARTAGSVDPAEVTAGYATAFRTACGVLLLGVVVMLAWLPTPSARPANGGAGGGR